MIKTCRLWGKKPQQLIFLVQCGGHAFYKTWVFQNLNHQKMLLKKQVCRECPRTEL